MEASKSMRISVTYGWSGRRGRRTERQLVTTESDPKDLVSEHERKNEMEFIAMAAESNLKDLVSEY